MYLIFSSRTFVQPFQLWHHLLLLSEVLILDLRNSSLGIKEITLKKEDILFINLLNIGDIAKLAKKCGLVLPKDEELVSIKYLCTLEVQRFSILEGIEGGFLLV